MKLLFVCMGNICRSPTAEGVMRHLLREEGLEVIDVPVGQLAIFLVVSLVIGVLAALLPARRAARLDVLQAISTD